MPAAPQARSPLLVSDPTAFTKLPFGPRAWTGRSDPCSGAQRRGVIGARSGQDPGHERRSRQEPAASGEGCHP